jgi:DNA-binding NarL/FixJ family response regulator
VVLLAAARGPLQDGLQAALGAIPKVTLTEHAGDVASVLGRVAESCPSLVVLDDSLRGDTTLLLLRLIKSVSPDTRCLVLTDDARRLSIATSNGADAVMLQGTPPMELFETIEQLLDQPGALGGDGDGCEEGIGRDTPRDYSGQRMGESSTEEYQGGARGHSPL